MNPVLAGLSVACVLAGLCLVADGVSSRARASSTGGSTSLWKRVDRWWSTRSRRQRALVGMALAGGIAGYVVTGWLLALVGIPLVALGVPALLTDPPQRELDILEALDRWVRSISASIPTGKSITDAMRATAAQAPALLAVPVRVMIARLDAHWTTREALLALAEDLDSADADAVIAALVLAAERGGGGAARTLDRLADTIQARLRALREIEAERAKPRVVVRQVTVISLVMISAALVLEPDFFRPYRSPVGQVLTVGLVLVYLGSLLVMRRMTAPRRRERILRHEPALARRGVDHG